MPVQVELRPAVPGDEPFLRALFEATRTAEFSMLPLAEEPKRALVDMQFRAQRLHYQATFPGASYWLLIVDGNAVGSLAAQEQDHMIRAIDIAVAPQHQNLGIGTAAFQALIDLARQSGKPIMLHVALTNRARRLYERLGFVQTGEDGMYAEMTWRPGASG